MNDNVRIIAIAGNGYGCGKTLFAETVKEVIEHELSLSSEELAGDVYVWPIATPLKEMLGRLLPRWRDIQRKEEASDALCGKTVREGLQLLGSEWGRKMIGEDVWINNFAMRVKNYELPTLFIVDDMRFPNELKKLREEFGAETVYIYRLCADKSEVPSHGTEGNVMPSNCKYVYDNSDKSYIEARCVAEKFAHEWLKRHAAFFLPNNVEECSEGEKEAFSVAPKPVLPPTWGKIDNGCSQGELPCSLTAESPIPCPCYESPYVRMVTEFQRTFDPKNLSFDPKRLDKMLAPEYDKLIALRKRLLYEEVQEFTTACIHFQTSDEENEVHKAKVAMADALGDILVVTIGTALAFGFDIDTIMKRIHDSNMSKLGPDGKPIYRGDGKIMKGPNFKAPVLEDLV